MRILVKPFKNTSKIHLTSQGVFALVRRHLHHLPLVHLFRLLDPQPDCPPEIFHQHLRLLDLRRVHLAPYHRAERHLLVCYELTCFEICLVNDKKHFAKFFRQQDMLFSWNRVAALLIKKAVLNHPEFLRIFWQTI